MSDVVSALPGAVCEGYVRVEETGLQGMITLRGDLSSKEVKAAVKKAVGLGVPAQRQALSGPGTAALWMSPDELLLLCAYDEVAQTLATLESALAGQHFLAVNVSDARAMFRVTGASVREIVAKLCPVDMAPGAFGPGQIRRTRMGQVPAAFWMPDEQTAQIVCFRSVAQYAFDLLGAAAAPGGEVRAF